MIETTPLTSRVKGIQVSLRRRGLPGESAACFLCTPPNPVAPL